MPEFAVVPSSTPTIRRLTIQRFRGIQHLRWYPNAGLNLVLGGGDVGKTTILESIALLLSPSNNVVVTDADYWQRDTAKGFCIEAVMSLPESSGINHQKKQAYPWDWDGGELKYPQMEGEPDTSRAHDPVYCVRVSGTSDFDVSYEIVHPDESVDHFSVNIRRKIGLVRLSGDDRNDRDLRLIQGSALERLISDKTLRSKLGKKLSEADIQDELKEDAQAKLTVLDDAFAVRALPTGLRLGLTGGHGLSVNALIGLTAEKDGVHLPLASWGAGTRRWAALQIAAAQQGENPIVVVDEAERGLEPYRQRRLMSDLQVNSSQVFVTTHSPTAINAAKNASVWYLDANCNIGPLPTKITGDQTLEPEMFLARLAIIAEGKTEVGFLRFILERELQTGLLDHGIYIADGCGNDKMLALLEALVNSGLTFAAFGDDEGRSPTKWLRIQQKLGNLLFRWPQGCLEENVVNLVPDERLEELISDTQAKSGTRLRTLATRLDLKEKDFAVIKAKAPNLRRLIIEAATGSIPAEMEQAATSTKKEWKSHCDCWYKSIVGGSELARKVYDFGLWPRLSVHLSPFIESIRSMTAETKSKAAGL